MASQLLIKPQQHDVFKITHETQQFLLFPPRIYSLHFKQKVLLILFFQWTEMTHTSPHSEVTNMSTIHLSMTQMCLSVHLHLAFPQFIFFMIFDFKLNLLILKQISASVVIHVYYLVTLWRRRVLHQNPRSPFWHNDEYNNLITKWKSANSGRQKTW